MLFTSQLCSLQLQGGMLGPIQIVLIGGLLANWHLHVTAHKTIQSINELTEPLYTLNNGTVYIVI